MQRALGPFQEPSVELFTERLGISRAAAELYLASDVVDLHLESFSFYRALGYHPYERHRGGAFGTHFYGQADIPRLLEAGVTGAVWSLTAHPLRAPEGREERFFELLDDLERLVQGADGRLGLARSLGDYRAARALGKQAAFVGIQGANLLPPDPSVLARLEGRVLRITLLHLTNTEFGRASVPLPSHRRGLSDLGRAFVQEMNRLKIGVDLAHIDREGFWDAVAASDKTLPLFVTHTGVSSVFPHFRNLDDDQLRAVAEQGGTVGIMLHSAYLGDRLFSGKLDSVVRHVLHAVRVIGAEHVSIGTDWDGAISTPRDMPTCLELPKLVDRLLAAGLSEVECQATLGKSALRVIGELRP